jgi:hypothetical protein
MTSTEQTWAERVAAWRESGLTSEGFSKGRGFKGNALRNWAWRMGLTKRRRPKPTVRLARVVRPPPPGTTARIRGGGDDAGMALEVGTARIVVRAGFDRATLAALLDVLSEQGGPR